MAYERINWQNESSGGTPLSAENLNHMDSGIAEAIQKIDSRLAINVDGTLYPITLISQRTVDGVEGFLITIDLGNSQESTFFVADGVGLNAVKSAIEAQIPSAVVVDSNLNGTSTNPVQNSAIVTALTGKLNSPAGGTAGQVLQKTTEGARWADVGTPSQEQIDEAVTEYINDHPESISALSETIKVALLQIAQKVAYTDEHGQDYYDALYTAFYPPAELVSITAVYTQSGTVYDTDSLDDLKSDLVVTALYSDSTSEVITSGYTLSGTLTEGTSTITVSYGGQMTTFTVTVTHYVRPSLYNWDFTQSLTDTVQGQVAILGGGVSQNESGLSFTSANGGCMLGDVFPPGRTLEIDVASVSLATGGHRTLFSLPDVSVTTAPQATDSAFLFRNQTTPEWGFYKGAWTMSGNQDGALFAGKTAKVKYYYSSDDGKYHTDVYADDTLVQAFSTTSKWNRNINPVQIGNAKNAYYRMVVTGARIYEGVD